MSTLRDAPKRADPLVRVLRTVVVVGCVLAAAGTIALIVGGHADLWWSRFGIHNALFPLLLAYFLWHMIPQQPRNPVVWTLVASSLGGWYVAGLAVVATLLGPAASSSLAMDLNPSSLSPGTAWVMTFSFSAPILAFFPLLTLGLLLFPDGKPPSARWRPVVVLAILAILVTAGGDAWGYRPGSLSNDGPLLIAGLIAFAVAAVLSLAALVVRYRTSTGLTRQQFKWIVWGASVFAPVIVATTVFSGTRYEGMTRVISLVAGFVMLACYAIAVGRYRLYEVDLVINRTLVFVLLAGFITLVYAAFVVGMGEIVGGGNGLVLPVVATGVVAVAFEPVRQRAQRWANRVVYGRRATPYEVLSDLTARLATGEQGEGILTRMVGLLSDGTGADRATVWLGSPGDMRAVASRPEGVSVADGLDLDAEEVFPVLHDGEVVGALEVVKPPGSALSHAESLLVSDLAGSSGLVLGYQRLNESLAQRAEEVEESRLRLMGAQDEERRRLERELHDGAQQLIVELENEVTVASGLAREHHAADLASLLDGVAEEAGAALEDVRSLAKGIYPAVLESDGLVAALAVVQEGAPVEVIVNDVGIGRYPLDVEAAVYFDISEAVTNAVKHAHPPIEVELDDVDGLLRFTVADAGPGFDPVEAKHGSGLENMADRMDSIGGRLDVVSEPGGVTRVTGEVALRTEMRGPAGDTTLRARSG